MQAASSRADSVNGGAIVFTSSGTLTITLSRFEYLTSRMGGAFYVSSSGDVSVTTSNFTSDVATFSGGAIYLKNANFTISHNRFITNTASPSYKGGALYTTVTSSSSWETFAEF